MGKDLSWAGKKSYQPYFELPNAKEPVKRSKPLEGTKRKISKEKISAKVIGFKESIAYLCNEVQSKPVQRKLKPAEIRAKRHAEKRYEVRFRK